jgi:hypothetical protein
MTAPGNDLLLLAGKVIAILLQGAMAIGVAALAIALPAVILFGANVTEGFEAGSGIDLAAIPVGTTAGLLAILLLILAGLFVFFGKLRAIIDTVGAGDPFAPVNAERLSHMAWIQLGVQILLWPAALLGDGVLDWANGEEAVEFVPPGAGLDITGILMILVLFILARVFRHGAAMREDLEGTV